MKSFAFAVIAAVSILAYAQNMPFNDEMTKKINSWNQCETADDCHSVGYSKEDIRCPALCGYSDFFINKKFEKDFNELVAPFAGPSCIKARCKAGESPFKISCVSHKCVLQPAKK